VIMAQVNRYIYYLSFLFLIVMHQACNTYPNRLGCIEKNGRCYGEQRPFNYRWWNYYEAALSFLEGGFIDEAIQYLNESIRQRPDDCWRISTYGYHYTNFGYAFFGYFPHRELGIIFFKQQKYKEAIRELVISRQTEDSARARYYLRLARMLWLQITQLDKDMPQIVSLTPESNIYTNATKVIVKGTAVDDTFIDTITIQGKSYPFVISNKGFADHKADRIHFNAEIPILGNRKDKVIHLLVSVVDLAGNKFSTSIKLNIDRKGPDIILEKPFHKNDRISRNLIIKGSLYDTSGISCMKIDNEQPILYNGLKELRFQKKVCILPGQEKIYISVSDCAGNTHTATIDLSDVRITLPDKPLIYVDRGNKRKTLSTAFLNGKVTDDTGVTQITINGKEIFRGYGKIVYFQEFKRLKLGENRFTIKCTNDFGKTSTKTIQIIREPSLVHHVGSRMQVAVYPFLRKYLGHNNNLTLDAKKTLLNEMKEKQARFNPIDRKTSDWFKQEQKISKAEKREGVDTVLFSTAWEWNDEVNIDASLVNTETNEILSHIDVFGANLTSINIQMLIKGLYIKLKEDIPLLDGWVVKAEKNSIITDIGKNSGLKSGMKFILYKINDSQQFSSTMAIDQSPIEILGQAWITQVVDNMSYADISYLGVTNFNNIRVITR